MRCCIHVYECPWASLKSHICSDASDYPHHKLLIQWGYQSDTNPPLMSQASQERHWHFKLRPSPFSPAMHGWTSAPVRCSFIPTLVRWGSDSHDWWIIWDLTGDRETSCWDKDLGNMASRWGQDVVEGISGHKPSRS